MLQKLNRDTQKCAFKCSEITKLDGTTTLVYKDPITDKGKLSKKGRLSLEKDPASGKLVTKTEGTGIVSWHPVHFALTSRVRTLMAFAHVHALQAADDLLCEVFREGVITKEVTFSEVRANASL